MPGIHIDDSNTQDEVLEFIQRRFSDNCHWTDGNCYYFTIILMDRFRGDGDIYYDVIAGHFIFKHGEKFYDWNGIFEPYDDRNIVRWDDFKAYDELQFERIIEDCIL